MTGADNNQCRDLGRRILGERITKQIVENSNSGGLIANRMRRIGDGEIEARTSNMPIGLDSSSKYNRQCKGVTIDVYDVLQAFEVTNPALQHLIKKALCAGLRGHKDRQQDLQDILDSARRAIELEIK